MAMGDTQASCLGVNRLAFAVDVEAGVGKVVKDCWTSSTHHQPHACVCAHAHSRSVGISVGPVGHSLRLCVSAACM